MDIRTVLPREHVIIPVVGASQKDIFACLIEPLVRDGIVTDREAFLASLAEREAEVSTQVEGGVAFPHARSQVVTRLALTTGLVSGDGLRFDPKADELCRVFFLLAVPATAPTAHLPLLRYLAKFAHAGGKIERLLKAPTPAAALRVLANFRG